MFPKYPKFDGTQKCADIPVNYYYKETDDNKLPRKSREELHKLKRQAKSLCYQCPFRKECLDWALHYELYGVWGGIDEDQRKIMRKELGIKCKDRELLLQFSAE